MFDVSQQALHCNYYSGVEQQQRTLRAATEACSATHHAPEDKSHVAVGATGLGCRANITPTPPATAAAVFDEQQCLSAVYELVHMHYIYMLGNCLQAASCCCQRAAQLPTTDARI
jgi:hypothetical protein